MLRNIFKKREKVNVNNEKPLLITALLIHAAKMDENLTEKEENIIKRAISNLFNLEKKEVDSIYSLAVIKEKNSNQILEYTKVIKDEEMSFRIKILELIWEIICSDKKVDSYESNLISRICGLLYIPSREAGEIKQKVKLNLL